MPSIAKKFIRATAAILLVLTFAAAGYAQQDEDKDAYKLRFNANWWYSNPTGSIHGAGKNGYFDLTKDFAFGSYSTFSGLLDWHFKRKHHFLFSASPVTSDSTVNLHEQVQFKGVTYDAGERVTASIRSLSFAPGYQYDIIRRNSGYLGFKVQLFLLDTKASLSGTGTLNGVSAYRSVSDSVFAPLPALGPAARWYPLHNSSRLSLEGYAQGMYFFGYGDFATARGTVGMRFYRHWTVRAGYEMGNDLSIHGSKSQIGIRLIQKGPVVGLEGSW